MDLSAARATARGASLPMSSSSSSRKEWRAVSEHHQARSDDDEDFVRPKLGITDERAPYEAREGREPVDVDFSSTTIDGRLDNDILQQRLHTVSVQREELQQMEIELRAQFIVRSEIVDMQNKFDAQLKEQASAANRLQEQLHEREQVIHELERRMEEKNRELHAIKLDNEAAWAKDDLLREQNKELATFRRERDHSEVERSQHIKQLQELQEHIQEKERQIIELQEQQRVVQETILFKDDRLREAQAWIARVQEMDAFQSNSLQAELRDRTEQYNQLWLVWQRQFAEMERHHVHTVQQLQLELADARERSGTYTEESGMTETNSKDGSQIGHSGNHLDANGGVMLSRSSMGVSNGNPDNVPSYASTGNTSTQTEHVAGMPIAPSSLTGVPGYPPPGQVPAQHPFVMHQQGVPHSSPSHVHQSQAGHFPPMPGVSPLQQWQNQQSVSEGVQLSAHNQTQTDQHILRSDAKCEYEMPANGRAVDSNYLDAHINQGTSPHSVITSSAGEPQALESTDTRYLVAPQSEQSLQQISSQFRDALRLDSHEQNSETKDHNNQIANYRLEADGLTAEHSSSAMNMLLSNTSAHSVGHGETTVKTASGATMSASNVSGGRPNSFVAGKASEANLLDERSLLACIVRTIPSGGSVQISSTLPNRLGKMLAPFHWHDYKKKYGKLEDFVASHPELFVIEGGDLIQLREGAQEKIAATAAVAKVAAAAAASTPHATLLPSVAVTPMAQPHRVKKTPSSDQHRNIVHVEQNGLENTSGQPSVYRTVANGANPDTSSFRSNHTKGSANGRPNSSFAGKHSGRTTGAASTSRR